MCNQFKIKLSFSIRDAFKKMDDGGINFCVCVNDDDEVIGVITDGDFRHAIHKGIQLDENVEKIITREFYSVQKLYTNEEIDSIFSNTIVEQVPVLDNSRLIDIVTLEKFYGKGKGSKRRTLDIPVVIMAGGKGTRLDPFTRILPKPLIPLGNDAIIKVIMDEFGKFGINNFYVSLRDKGIMIRAYFFEHRLKYKINYIYEKKPLGTAGALSSLEDKIKDTFFVSNCDIIIRSDYGAFYDFHKKGNYGLTMVGSMQQHTVPYGVCEIDNEGTLKSIKEKPQYDFLVNTGLYLLEPDVIKYIPKDSFFNMTDLIRRLQKNGLKVGLFPVSEKSWIDIGQLSEYKETVNKLSLQVQSRND